MQRMTIRVPDEYREWLETAAKSNHRTLNGEIIEIFRKLKEEWAKQQEPLETASAK
ncbi:Arc family DNA-binding protein [Thiothrix litoralis]|uniref:Arc family DNA-binding protein n=1 Tax=Thiothrix litoralis TaxID=2891210 RepID=A0ABX7WWX4_9GAMM|nr:Arc family DNA-binding protein [Thiothrix litoralis]QTR47507.1 Arc family DNA-binding protein [Thiothrix litoralis]